MIILESDSVIKGRAKAMVWYYANRERALKRLKSYHNNPAWVIKRKEYAKKWYAKNRELILSNRKLPKNKEHLAKVKKAYNSRPEIKLRNKELKRLWDLKNRVVINKKRRKYCKDKYHSNAEYKLRLSIHNQLVKGLRYNCLTKKNRTFVLLGYSVNDLKLHLESQFNSKMSWENYGSYWHIDHKIPKSFACTEQELLELFRLDNLQPLEAKLNISKHNRIIADLFGSGGWN